MVKTLSGLQAAAFSLYLHMLKGEIRLSGVSSYKGINPIPLGPHPYCPNQLPKTPSQNTTTMQVRDLTYECAQSLSCVQLFATLRTVACQAPLPMGILQARILEWVAMPSSRGSSQPKDRTQASCIAGGFFTIWATREAFTSCVTLDKLLHLAIPQLLHLSRAINLTLAWD